MNTDEIYYEFVKSLGKRYGDRWEYIKNDGAVRSELDYCMWKHNKGEFTEKEVEWAYTQLDRLSSVKLTPLDVKVGDGVTVNLWSDRHACTVTKVTKAFVVVQRDKATLDPEFKPEWILGGFAGHCVNQDEQSYTYERDENGQTYKLYWSNRYSRYGQPGSPSLSKGRHEFYDYNF